MWVVKIGGSLCRDALLPQWLQLLTRLGGGRVALVAGGGTLADEVRRLQAQWQLSDVAAHNMALLAMAQNAYLMQALEPGLELASSEAEIRHVLRRGRVALWLPLEMRRDRPDAIASWDVTSDSLALLLAERINAEHVVLVKSCAIEGQRSWAELGDAGIVDRGFAALAREAAFPIELLNKDDLARARSLLLGETRVSV